MEKLKKYNTFLAMKDHHVGKTGKWMQNLLTGKKDREKQSGNSSNLKIPINGSGNGHRLTTANKEEQRWSFRGLSTASPRRWDSNSVVVDSATTPPVMDHHNDHMANDSKKHTLAVVAATEAAVAAAKAAAAVIQLTAAAPRRGSAVEEASAIKIQSVFRAYLARKALKALKGLVKLQALVRGHLVRKQATARLRYTQAPMTVRARIRLLEMAEKTNATAQRQLTPTTSTQGNKLRNLNQDFDEGIEENTETMEIDIRNREPLTKARNSHTNHTQFDTAEHTSISTKSASIKKKQQQISPATSSITDRSPRRCSNHFKEHSFSTAPKSPDLSRLRFSHPRSERAESPNNEYTSYPNYMANTKSSKAKVRCHSTPKQRPAETNDRQPSRERPSLQGTNVSNAVRMQRSLANDGSTAQNYKYSWFVTLNRSTVSLHGSERG